MEKFKLPKSLIAISFIFILGCLVLFKDRFPMSFHETISIDHQELQTNTGLKILFLKDDSLPSIYYNMFFPQAGSDYDFKNKKGLSSLTAYLMEQGAGGLNATALQKELNQLGTVLDVAVGYQTVHISLRGLSWHEEKLWDLFGKILTEPHFQDKEMELLRKQFLESRLQLLDDPSTVISHVWRRTTFGNSTGHSLSGTLDSLSKITLEDIKSFYQNRYFNGNPILIIVGQYSKKLKKDIISFFNKQFQKKEQKTLAFPTSHKKASFTLLTKRQLGQAHIHLGHLIDSFPTKNPREFIILNMAAYILGGGMGSRLFLKLREEKGLTYSVFSSVDMGKFYGTFEIAGSTKTASARDFLEETLTILKTFKEKGIDSEELKPAKRYLKTRYAARIETPEHRLHRFIYLTHYLGLDAHFSKNYINIVESISPDEVNAQIKKVIWSKPLQVVVYGHPSLQAQLKDLKDLATLHTISFEEYFKEELKFKPFTTK